MAVALERLEKALIAVEGLNEPEMVEVAVHMKSGIQHLKRCRDRRVSTSVQIIRYLVIDPSKRALESSLDDGWKLILQAGLVALLTALLKFLGIL